MKAWYWSAGSIDKIQYKILPVTGFIGNAHGLGLNRNAALTFQIHAVQYLFIVRSMKYSC